VPESAWSGRVKTDGYDSTVCSQSAVSLKLPTTHFAHPQTHFWYLNSIFLQKYCLSNHGISERLMPPEQKVVSSNLTGRTNPLKHRTGPLPTMTGRDGRVPHPGAT